MLLAPVSDLLHAVVSDHGGGVAVEGSARRAIQRLLPGVGAPDEPSRINLGIELGGECGTVNHARLVFAHSYILALAVRRCCQRCSRVGSKGITQPFARTSPVSRLVALTE